MSLDRYNAIKKIPIQLELVNINAYIPKLTDRDYTTGYIQRFFIQQSNDQNSPIYEVSSKQINKFDGKPFYKIAFLDWRLTGTIEEIKESNSASVRIASATLPKIQLYLPNLLQFHKQ
jgi:hypothetical protein